jgi:hypothetical protein
MGVILFVLVTFVGPLISPNDDTIDETIDHVEDDAPSLLLLNVLPTPLPLLLSPACAHD